MKRGFTLIETLVAIAILAVILNFSFVFFGKLNSRQVVDKSADLILSTILEARSLSLSSKDNSSYGIYFEASRLTLFKGSSYFANEPSNIVIDLNTAVSLGDISLDGGEDYVVFDRLTGKTSQNGTVTVHLNTDVSSLKTVTIYKTGLAEIN